MGPLFIVLLQPGVQVHLQSLQAVVEFLAKEIPGNEAFFQAVRPLAWKHIETDWNNYDIEDIRERLGTTAEAMAIINLWYEKKP